MKIFKVKLKKMIINGRKYEFIEFNTIDENGEPLWSDYYDKEFYLDKQRTMGERRSEAIPSPQKPLD